MNEVETAKSIGLETLHKLLKIVEEYDGNDNASNLYANWPFIADRDAVLGTIINNVSNAIAEVERVLPGWAWKIGTCCVSDDACIFPDFNHPVHGERLQTLLGCGGAKVSDFDDRVWDSGIDIDRRPSGMVAATLLEAMLHVLIRLAGDKEAYGDSPNVGCFGYVGGEDDDNDDGDIFTKTYDAVED